MSVRRPLWVQRLAFVIFELTDPAGAARLRMSRGALNEAGSGPAGRSLGLDDPASLSALSGEDTWRNANRHAPAPGPALMSRGPSSPLSASDHAAEADLPPRGPAVRLVPGLGRTRSVFFFGFVVLGLPLGVAAATIARASL